MLVKRLTYIQCGSFAILRVRATEPIFVWLQVVYNQDDVKRIDLSARYRHNNMQIKGRYYADKI